MGYCCCFGVFALKDLWELLKRGVFWRCYGLKVGRGGKILDKKCKELRILRGGGFGSFFGGFGC